MADKKISELSAAATLTGTEQSPVVQSSATVRTTASDIAMLARSSGPIVQSASSSSGTLTLNFSNAQRPVFTTTLTENVTTLTLSSLPVSGYIEYELHITQNGTGGWTFAMPASHKALGGSDTAIASAANAVTVLSACTVDGGTTWRYAMQESA